MIKPLTKPQFLFLQRIAEPDRRRPGIVQYWFLGAVDTRFLGILVRLGFLKLLTSGFREYGITEAGWAYLSSNGVETLKEYRARRRREGKEARADQAVRKEESRIKAYSDVDEFLQGLPS